jgi:MOSC domain-containing protein YiiM
VGPKGANVQCSRYPVPSQDELGVTTKLSSGWNMQAQQGPDENLLNSHTRWPLLSLRAGPAKPFGPRQEPSAIAKTAVSGPVLLDLTGLMTDEQGDLRSHGGPEKALLHYPSEHYLAWRAEMSLDPNVENLEVGGFGENISTHGLSESDVAVGDIFELGGAVIQVSQPRQPCWKLNIRFNVSDMARKVQNSGRTGWYYRVLRSGIVEPQDSLVRVERLDPDWSLRRVQKALYHDRLNIDELTQLASLRGLTPKMQNLVAARLQHLKVENWSPRLNGRV